MQSPNPTTGTNRLTAVSSLSATRAWAVGYSVDASGNELPLVAHWDGTGWTGGNIAAAAAGKSRLTGVAAIGANDVVAVGFTVKDGGDVAPLIERWNGTTWTASNPSAGVGDHRLLAVTATSSTDVTAVGYTHYGSGDAALVLRWNGVGWIPAHPSGGAGDDRLEGVTALGATEVVAVGRTDTPLGSRPLVLRWSGTSWAASTPDAGTGDHELRAVTDAGVNSVTAVGVSTTPAGSAPLVLRWSGTSWSAAHPLSSGELDGVAAIAAGDAWAVGKVADATLALHWDGTSWTAAPTPNGTGTSGLAGVAAVAATDVWAVGGDATGTLAEHYTACAPTAVTEAATDTTQGGATLHASVNPNGLATDVRFQYGTTTAYGSTTTVTAVGSGTAAVPVATPVTGLSPGTTYHARVVATSSAGTANGEDVTFTTASAPTVSLAPAATTVAEGDTGFRTVTLTATLSAPSTQTVTVHWATANGTATAGTDYTAGGGTLTFVPGDVSETVTVRVLGDDLDEGDETFTLSLSSPANATLGAATSTVTISDDDTKPDATTDPASAVTQTAATLNGTVDPNGKATTYRFDYGTTAAYGSSTATTSAGSGTAPVAVSAQLSGLTAGATYHFRVVAVSAAGTSSGADRTFTTGQPVLSIADASATETDSPGTSITFTVTLSSASTGPVTVAYATAAGTATDPEDYAGRSGTLTFAAGATTRTIAVPIVGDTLDEPDETFTVSLSAPTGASIADGQATGTIVDNDPPPGVRADDASVAEGGGQASITVRLLAPSGKTVTVAFATVDGTAAAGADYTAASGTLTFTPGQTTKTVTVAITGDALDEDDETFAVHLSGPVNATIAADGTVTIVDDDPQPKLSVDDPSVTEGTGGTSTVVFTVTLAPAAGRTVSVDYATVNGTAVAPDDFAARSGTLTFARGETTKQVSVTVVGDALFELNETFSLALSSPVKADLLKAAGTATILDDDAPPSLVVSDASAVEGASLTFTIRLCAAGTGGDGQPACAPAAAFTTTTVNFNTAAGTACGASPPAFAGLDFQAVGGQRSILTGDSATTFVVPTTPDRVKEPDKKLCAQIQPAEGSPAVVGRATGIGTIVDDDSAPVVSVNDVRVTEGDGGSPVATFTVTFSNPSEAGASVDWATFPGSATAPADYTASSGTVTMEPPDDAFSYRLAYSVSVPIVGDALDEPDEQFTLVLSNPKLATIGRGTGTATIGDDDAPPVAVTGDAAGIGPSGAALAGVANPGTKATSAWFEYGPTIAYGSSTPASALPGDGVGRTIRAALSGLQFGTGYHFRLVASNATGTAYGADNAFATAYPPAEAATGGASAVTASAATVAGTARTYGLAGTAWFEYGTTAALGRSTQPQTLAAGAVASVVTDTLSGLADGTTYHFRLVVRRGDEVVAGEDATFATSRLVQAPPTKPKPKPTPKPAAPSFSAISSGIVSGSSVTFAVRCIKATPSCRGTIAVDAATRALSGASNPVTTRIGQAAFTRRPGGTVQVRVHIGPRAVDAVRKARRLAVVATITVRDSAAKATHTMRLTLTMPRRG